MLTESYWPATDEIALLDTTCGGVLRARAALTPLKTALIEAHTDLKRRRRWSYVELLAAAEQAARALCARLKPGDHVAVWAANTPEWVILQFGLALAGMVLVTVNPAYRAAELAYVLRQSRARAIFHQREYRGVAMTEVVDECLRAESLTVMSISLEQFADFVRSHDRETELPDVSPAAPCMIQYTSGTTGRPKGALLNHFSVTNNARLMALLKELGEDTINLAVAPLFHTAGCVGNILGSIQTGGTIVLPTAFDADSMLDLTELEHVSYTFAVPTMLIGLLEAQARRPRDLTSLQIVFSGGAIVPIEVVRRVEAEFGVRLIIGYGQTESSPGITHTRLDDNATDKSETIGRPLSQVEVKIVDSTGAITPINQPGELCTRGFLVMMGYFEMPEATAAAIDHEGWLHTGDLCTMDARGYCRITGRLKDMIIRGGENIYPREVEELLYRHPAVAEAAVFGAPDDYWGETVAAAVTLKEGAVIQGEALREFAAPHLARHKLPVHWFAMDTIPVTASGKIQKFRLIELYRAGALEAARI
ncbi:MAG: AMP-binding protein [Gammaproteobacteria bacterium]